MARLGRGVPPQSYSTPAGIALGPRPPSTLRPPPPVVTTLNATLATGLLTNQRRVQLRRSSQLQWQPQRRVTTSGNDTGAGASGTTISSSTAQYGQQFVAYGTNLSTVTLRLLRFGTPTDGLTVEIHADAAGVPDVPVLATTTLGMSVLPTSALVRIAFPVPLALTPGVAYWIVAKRSGATDAVNAVAWVDIGGVADNPATSAFKSGAGAWTTGTFSRAFAESASFVFDNVSAQLPMIGVRPPFQIGAPAPVVTTLSTNPATGLLTNQRRAQQRRTTSCLQPPTILARAPVVTTLEVNFAARGRETICRFPLQGWDGGGATGGPVGTVVLDLSDGGRGDGDSIGFPGVAPALAQSFAGLGGRLSYVEVSVLANGSPLDNLVAEIRPDDGSGVAPSNTVLATASIAGTALTSSFAATRFSLSLDLDPSRLYWCVLRRSGASDAANFYRWEIPTIPSAFHADSFDGAIWQDLNPDRVRLLVAAAYAGTPVLTRRNLGPFPPLVVTPLPSQPQQTVATNLATGLYTNQRRVQQRRTTQLAWDTQFTCATNPVLVASDSLVRANANPLDGNWINKFGAAAAGANFSQNAQLLSNAATGTTANGGAAFWSQRFGPNCAVEATIAALGPTSAQHIYLLVRLQNVGPGADHPTEGIGINIDGTGSGRFCSWNGTNLINTTFIGPTFQVGDVVRLEAIGTILRVYQNGALIAALSFSTRTTSGGAIGFGSDDTTGAWTNFSFYDTPTVGVAAVAFRPMIGVRPPIVLASPPLAPVRIFAPVAISRARRAPLAKSLLFPPATLANPPPLENVVRVHTSRARRLSDESRFPLPGWEQREADEGASTGSTVATATDNNLQTSGIKDGSSFTALGTNLIGVSTWWQSQGTPVDQIIVEVQSDIGGKPSGVVLVSTQFTPSTVVATPIENKLSLAVSGLTPGANYWLVAYRTGSTDVVNYFQWNRQFFASGPGWRATFTGTWSAPVRSQYAAVAYFSNVSGPQTPLALLSRRLGPRPPLLLAQTLATLGQQTVKVNLRPKVRRAAPVFSRLTSPTVVTTAAFVAAPIAVKLTVAHPRVTRSLLPKTIVAAAFTARPTNVALTHARPRPTVAKLRPPTVVRVPSVEQREQTVQVSLARTRPRHTFTSLPETIVTATAFTAEPITVALSRVRSRQTTSFLARPVTLSTFNGPLVATVKTRPRLTITKLNEPTVIRVPSVEQQEDTVKVSLTRTRPRPTVKTLAGPTTLREFVGPQVTTVRTKPRSTVTRLGEPTVVRVPSVEQQEQTIRVALVRIGPRPTSKCLNPPRVVRVPSVEQVEQTVRVALTHTRPRPTVTRLEAPAVVRRPAVGNIATTLVGVKTRRDMSHQFSLQSARQRIVRETGSTVTYQQRDPFIGPRPPQIIDPLPSQRVQTIGVYEPRIKPRPTRTKLSAPTKINPLPTLRMQTVQVALVKTRPRKTVQVLAKPTVVAAGFTAPPIASKLTRARPRPTTKALYEPTVVRVPSVEQQEDTIKVSLARIRPRPTTRLLGKPVVLRVFDGANTATVTTRPRPTTYVLREPVVVRQAAFYGPLVVLARTRPRPTTKELTPPTVVTRPTFSGPEVFTVKTRPRPTVKTLGEPTVVRVPSIEQLRRTILVTLTRTRPRHVVQTLRLPTVLRTFVGPRVTLVKSGPRPTTRRLSPPTRLLIQSVFQAQQTIRVKFVQTRPRPTTRRLAPPTKLAVQAVFQKQQTIRTALVQTKPQPTTTTLNPPTKVAVASVFQVQQTVQVRLTRIVPPPTVPVLRAPEVVATTTRAVAITNPSHPNEATTSATERTEASLSSGRTDTIARVSESEATEATVSESEVTEAETEAT